MRDLVVTSQDQEKQELIIVPILKLPTVMGLTQLSNQSIHVFLMESIIGGYYLGVVVVIYWICVACSVNSILGGSPAVVANGTMIYQEEVCVCACAYVCVRVLVVHVFCLATTGYPTLFPLTKYSDHTWFPGLCAALQFVTHGQITVPELVPLCCMWSLTTIPVVKLANELHVVLV